MGRKKLGSSRDFIIMVICGDERRSRWIFLKAEEPEISAPYGLLYIFEDVQGVRDDVEIRSQM